MSEFFVIEHGLKLSPSDASEYRAAMQRDAARCSAMHRVKDSARSGSERRRGLKDVEREFESRVMREAVADECLFCGWGVDATDEERDETISFILDLLGKVAIRRTVDGRSHVVLRDRCE